MHKLHSFQRLAKSSIVDSIGKWRRLLLVQGAQYRPCFWLLLRQKRCQQSLQSQLLWRASLWGRWYRTGAVTVLILNPVVNLVETAATEYVKKLKLNLLWLRKESSQQMREARTPMSSMCSSRLKSRKASIERFIGFFWKPSSIVWKILKIWSSQRPPIPKYVWKKFKRWLDLAM